MGYKVKPKSIDRWNRLKKREECPGRRFNSHHPEASVLSSDTPQDEIGNFVPSPDVPQEDEVVIFVPSPDIP